jgi:hypothetical protein
MRDGALSLYASVAEARLKNPAYVISAAGVLTATVEKRANHPTRNGLLMDVSGAFFQASAIVQSYGADANSTLAVSVALEM